MGATDQLAAGYQLPGLLALRRAKNTRPFRNLSTHAIPDKRFSFLFSSLGKFKQTLIKPGKSYALS